MFADRPDTTPAHGRPEMHPAWRESVAEPSRPYINVRACFLGLMAAQGDEEAGREMAIRHANGDRYWHDTLGWPRWEKKT